ncbi:MAG: hypothetical protein M4579_000410 [Chaenotheca gracillima]|nr:MAG: hypothetical protein M4579_000410 [Chaenotheca gracillima]
MGCGKRDKLVDVTAKQKWDYINLSDFKSTSCLSPLSYGILYISLFISIAVYAVDTFTAVNLVIFDRWSGQIKPVIPFDISKWIFAACIIASFINLIFEWVRAVRVMRRGGIAESYLDPLAVRVQSVRVGKKGRGWRRFLVFAALTKGKKGVEYVALFVHFSFKAWIRIIFCEAPRQVINALTLYSLLQAQLIPKGEHAPSDGHSNFVQFWVNLGILGQENYTQVAILSGMTFTLVIWVISALNLLISCILYLIFLWHYIPSADSGLSGFCKRKIDQSLSKIVSKAVQKALDKEELRRQKDDAKAIKAGDKPPEFKRQPTLPLLVTEGASDAETPTLSRSETATTLPPYSSRPPTRSENRTPTVPAMTAFSPDDKRPYPPSRSGTQASYQSNSSYRSNVPLTSAASPMGYSQPGGDPSYGPPQDGQFAGGPRPPLGRSGTAASDGSQWGPPRPGTAQSQRSGYGPPRPGTAQSQRSAGYGPSRPGTAQSQRSAGYGPNAPPMPPPGSYDFQGRKTPGAPMGPVSPDAGGRSTPGSQFGPRRGTPGFGPDPQGRSTPGLPSDSRGRATPSTPYGRSTPAPMQIVNPPQNIGIATSPDATDNNSGGYVAFNPNHHAAPASAPRSASTAPSAHPFQRLPHRNATDPSHNREAYGDYFGPPPTMRSGTAPPAQDRSGYDDSIYDDYGAGGDEEIQMQTVRRPVPPPRSATAGPYGGGWNNQGRGPQAQPQQAANPYYAGYGPSF